MRRESDKLLRQAVVTRMEAQRRRMGPTPAATHQRGPPGVPGRPGRRRHPSSRPSLTGSGGPPTATAASLTPFASGRRNWARLYDFDHRLLEYGDRLSAALDAVETAIPSGEGLAEALRTVQSICAEANDTFSMREEVVLGAPSG